MGDVKKLSVLGATGSIGKNTLKVAEHLGLEVAVLAAHSDVDAMEVLCKKFRPKFAALFDEQAALELKKRIPSLEVGAGREGIVAAAAHPAANFVVSAIAGTLGLLPTLAALKAGKGLALANKEALVSGGELVMALAKQQGIEIVPIDSEHSALFQCLLGGKEVERLILTASGGPFRTLSQELLERVTVSDALKHPNWSMGKKVTIDSSTLMNKGLEVIEAKFLFDIPLERIEVVVHPQSIVHSMCEFIDGSTLAQMGEPDMIVPIQYALTHPERRRGLVPRFDWGRARTLEFYPPDMARFPCLRLAFEAATVGGSLPCFMNAANEVLVERFLSGGISWTEIARSLERAMSAHRVVRLESFEEIEAVEEEARGAVV